MQHRLLIHCRFWVEFGPLWKSAINYHLQIVLWTQSSVHVGNCQITAGLDGDLRLVLAETPNLLWKEVKSFFVNIRYKWQLGQREYRWQEHCTMGKGLQDGASELDFLLTGKHKCVSDLIIGSNVCLKSWNRNHSSTWHLSWAATARSCLSSLTDKNHCGKM